MAEMAVELDTQECLYDQYLSMDDIEKHPDWDKSNVNFEAIIYSMGVDLNKGWNFETCYHRPRTCNEIVFSSIVRFAERRDPEWVETGMQVSDLVRMISETTGSLRATGMRESLMEDSPMFAAMTAAAERFVVNAEIAVNDGESDLVNLMEGVKE